VADRYLRQHLATLREPFGALPRALLGVVCLILASRRFRSKAVS